MARALTLSCVLACALNISGCSLPQAPVLAPAPPVDQDIEVCIAVGLELTSVQAIYKPATGETLVWQGGKLKPFSSVYTVNNSYIYGKPFWIQAKPVPFAGKQYKPFDRRYVQRQDLKRIGSYSGSGVFARVEIQGTPKFIYLPLRPGCYFQLYKR